MKHDRLLLNQTARRTNPSLRRTPCRTSSSVAGRGRPRPASLVFSRGVPMPPVLPCHIPPRGQRPGKSSFQFWTNLTNTTVKCKIKSIGIKSTNLEKAPNIHKFSTQIPRMRPADFGSVPCLHLPSLVSLFKNMIGAC